MPAGKSHPRSTVALAALLAFGVAASGPLFGYTVTGYVWQQQPGDTTPQRVAWHPVDNPGNVNFLTPITYSVSAGGPGGAAVEVRAAFDRWNQVAGPSNIRYRFVPSSGDIVVEFTGNPAGVPGEATIGAGTGVFSLDATLVIRTDRFSLDIPPTNTVPSDPLDEYDVYTTTIHEVGHDLGLHHRRNGCAAMTAQNQARGIACVDWDPDPTAIVEGAPVGTLVYNNPRRILSLDDIHGLRTLYSRPSATLELTRSTFDRFAKRFAYEYRAVNNSLAASDYFLTRLEIPLPGIPAENIVTPAGWVLSAETGNDKIVWVVDAGNLGVSPGGNQVSGFEFDHPLAPQFGTSTTGFSLPNLSDIGSGPNGDFDDPGNPGVVDLFHDTIPPIGLAFDPNLVTAPSDGFVPDFFTADVPTLSEWGMLILTGLFLASIVAVMVRRGRSLPARGGTHA